MHHDDWQEELYRLVERAQGMGLHADLPNMPLIERWGLYNFLKRFCENES